MSELNVLVEQKAAVIEFSNFEEIKSALALKMKEYQGVSFTEDSKQAAKGELASLRKLKSSIDERRKSVKVSYMDPYNEFESKVKELVKLIDEPIGLIDQQVKAFDEKQRQEKRNSIKATYDEIIGGMSEYLPLDSIYDSKWENVSTSMKKIKEEIHKCVEETKTAVDTIKAMNSEKEADALQVLKETHSMARSVALITEYENQKKEILAREEKRRAEEEERKRQAEIERAKAEERAAVEKERKIREEVEREAAMKVVETQTPVTEKEEKGFYSEPVPEISDAELPFEQPSTKTVFFKVVATDEEIDQVETTLNSFGIYFERRDA